jgi:hypothetical protein
MPMGESIKHVPLFSLETECSVGGKAKVEGGSEQKWKEGGGEGDGDGGMLSV